MQGERVVYIGYTGGTGGVARQMFDLAVGVAASGLPVTVIVPVNEGHEPYRNRLQSVPNLTIVISPRIRFDTPTQNPVDVLQLLAPYRNSHLLHLHTGDICLPRVTLFALDILRPKRAVATVHSAETDLLPNSKRAGYWAAVARRQLKQVFCPSRHGRRTQIGLGLPAETVTTIYNGIDTSHYATGDGLAVRRELGIGPETPLLLFASRFHEQKRPLDAVATFGQVAAVRPDVHLTLIGSGPLESDVRQAVAELPFGRERVHLFGYRNDVPKWLAGATVYLFPTARENFSLSLIEALASGCPVVTTFCQGNDEILQPGENALTATVGDVRAMAQTVLRLLDNPEERARLGGKGRATAAQFTRERMVAEHLAWYAHLSGKSKSHTVKPDFSRTREAQNPSRQEVVR